MTTALEQAFRNALTPLVVGAQLATHEKRPIPWRELLSITFDTHESQLRKLSEEEKRIWVWY